MLDRLSKLNLEPGFIAFVLAEYPTFGLQSLNCTVASVLVDKRYRIATAPESGCLSRTPDIRVDDISHITGRMSAVLREWQTFDLRDGANLTEVNFTVTHNDAIKGAVIDESYHGRRGNVAKTPVKVHQRYCG